MTRKKIYIFDFRKCPLRPPEGQLGTTKLFPIGLELIFFMLDLNFSWLDLFFPAGFFWPDLILFDPTSDLKTYPTDTFFALFCPFFALFGLTSYLDW